jgi:hypothetical protein
MPGGRGRRYTYPEGMPFPLVLTSIAWAIVGLSWVIFGLRRWLPALMIIAAACVLLMVNHRLHNKYERAGLAVLQPRAKQTRLVYVGRTPAGIIVLRCAVLALIGMVLIVGMAPISLAAAKPWLIGGILGILALAFVQIGFQRYYVGAGRARDE